MAFVTMESAGELLSPSETPSLPSDLGRLAERALAGAAHGVFIVDAKREGLPTVYANGAFCRAAQSSARELEGRRCLFPHNPDFERGARAALGAAIAQGRQCSVSLQHVTSDAAPCSGELMIWPVLDEHGAVTELVGMLSEASAFHADHDALTGLPNGAFLRERLAMAIGDETPSAMLCIGIDNVSRVNASLGRDVGDQMLKAVAQRLLGCTRAGDTLARHGGHEFLLHARLDDADGAQPLCEGILAALSAPFTIGHQNLHIASSIGLSLYPRDSRNGASLLRYADMALARADAAGGNTYRFFAPDMSEAARERIALEAALRLALEQRQMQLQYQPIASLHDGAVCALEALVRWQHPELGAIAPNRFLPIAQEAGLIGVLGHWILRRVCQDMRDWREAGAAPVGVAINISPRQFREPGLAHQVRAALEEFGIAPALFALEITETALLQDGAASAAIMAELKAVGIGLTLDDFGTGYSSLSQLKRFPIDLVKIDGELTRNSVHDTVDAALALTIIAMAHHLGIKVVAEGVETEAQCDFLRRNLCDQIQGYLFGAPAGALETAQLLAAGHTLPTHLQHVQKKRERTLLLVDDEQNIVSSLKRLLRRDGYHILGANSGEEGLDVLSKNAVDVIVSDQRMPGMLGADFLRAAKGLYPDTIRIMLSGYTELQSVTDAVNEGAIYKFLTKPWEDELLRGHIAEAFRLKEIADENERLNLELRSANGELACANRKMEELLSQKQQQITRDEVSLNIAREVMQFMPLAVIGIDDTGMVAFVNGAAQALLHQAGAMLGMDASAVLPGLVTGADDGLAHRSHGALIDGSRYDVVVHPMGANSRSRGSLITLNLCRENA